jgi:hypothetical protein
MLRTETAPIESLDRYCTSVYEDLRFCGSGTGKEVIVRRMVAEICCVTGPGIGLIVGMVLPNINDSGRNHTIHLERYFRIPSQPDYIRRHRAHSLVLLLFYFHYHNPRIEW